MLSFGQESYYLEKNDYKFIFTMKSKSHSLFISMFWFQNIDVLTSANENISTQEPTVYKATPAHISQIPG